MERGAFDTGIDSEQRTEFIGTEYDVPLESAQIVHDDMAEAVRDSKYRERIKTLSEGSVRRNFQAFEDVDWDNPEFAINDDDERWILTDTDNLGAHPWYKSLSKERQIEVGKYRIAHTMKVGSQFEQALISGIMAYNMDLPNNRDEFRYSMHEATEETNHIQMFQEFVNRSGVDTKGAPSWFRHIIPLVATASSKLPVAFWTGVLAGEEPIDHTQKDFLRDQENEMHPLVQNIMAIHVAEEARHIGFAHNYLEEQVPKMNRAQRAALSVAFPVIMRTLGDVIMRPGKEALEDMGVPKEVAKEVWWDSDESRQFLADLFPDARMLAEKVGLRGRLGRAAWRMMKIDGPESRFRNEPNRAHA